MVMKKCSLVAMFGAVVFLLTVCVCFASAYAQENTVNPPATTLDNLMAAYKGESNANARYLAFAEKANEEGYDAVASLFRAAAMAEQVHYERDAEIIRKLGGVPNVEIEAPIINSTKENLESALKGETYEKDVMYPAFIKQAEKENIKDAIDSFEDAGAAEGVHAKLYANMLKILEKSKALAKDFYVCPVCGNIVDVVTSSMCPICGVDTKKFKRVR